MTSGIATIYPDRRIGNSVLHQFPRVPLGVRRISSISPSSRTLTMMTQDEIDMSPQAVAARLDDVRALYRLMLYLGRFKAVETTVAQSAELPSQRSRG